MEGLGRIRANVQQRFLALRKEVVAGRMPVEEARYRLQARVAVEQAEALKRLEKYWQQRAALDEEVTLGEET